jgi:hypothetical protein
MFSTISYRFIYGYNITPLQKVGRRIIKYVCNNTSHLRFEAFRSSAIGKNTSGIRVTHLIYPEDGGLDSLRHVELQLHTHTHTHTHM